MESDSETENDHNSSDELLRYKMEMKVPESMNPLQWWKFNEHRYPIMPFLAKNQLPQFQVNDCPARLVILSIRPTHQLNQIMSIHLSFCVVGEKMTYKVIKETFQCYLDFQQERLISVTYDIIHFNFWL